jgi:hypothetical protein
LSRESIERKAERYLGERRLTIDVVSPDLIAATCRSDGVAYSVGWTPALGWTCTCPARGRCAHLLALKLVTVRSEGQA